MTTTFDKYSMADGLSQDEFVRMQTLMKMGFDEMDTGDMEELIGYFRTIIVAKDQQIVELNQELYEIHTAKIEHHDTQSTEKSTS